MIRHVEVLHGHVDFDTAIERGDYPYGRLTCTIRYWVETRPKFGQRFVSRTQNPKTGRWNAPKSDTYSDMVLLTAVPQDDGRTFIKHWSFSQTHITPVGFCRAGLAGVYNGMTDEQRATYDGWVARIRRSDAASVTNHGITDPWVEFDEIVDLVAVHIRDTGTDPQADNGLWIAPNGRRCYLGSHSDPDVYFAVARERLANTDGDSDSD